MKNLVLIPVLILALQTSGQIKKGETHFEMTDLVGVWQRNFKEVGNGLQQNFRFYIDSTFEIHFSNEDEDARDIRELKGTYRLANGLMYLTIRSMLVIEGGKVTITESTESGYIFHITGGTLKERKEIDPQESRVPIYIKAISTEKIMLDSETYYKMTKDDLKAEGIVGNFGT